MPAAAQQVWVGSIDSNYDTASNWSGPAAVPDGGATAVFTNNGAPTTVTLFATRSPAGFTFDAGAPTRTIQLGSGGQLNIGNGGVVNNSGQQQNFTIGAGAQIDFVGTGTAGNATYTVQSGGDLYFSQGSNGPTVTAFNNGRIVLRTTTGHVEMGGLVGTGRVIGETAGSATVQTFTVGAEGFSQTYDGTIEDGSAEIALVKSGVGTWTLGGDNTYTGGTTISGGTLRIGNGGNTGSIVGDVVNNATLAFSRSDSTSFGGVVSGTGGLKQEGPGTLTLTGTNTYTGGTSITSGTLQIGDGGTAGSIVGNVSNNGTLAFNRSDAISFGDVISGSGNLLKQGAGTMTLTADNTYTGGTTVLAGTLQVGNGGTAGWIVGDVTNNATLVFDRSDTTTFAGVISGSGALIKQGAGTLNLTGINTYSGGTTISGGTLLITGGTIAGDVVNNGALAFDATAPLIAGVVSGTGSVTIQGGSSVAMTGANTYTGGTIITASSTLQIGGGGSTGSIVGNVVNDGQLTFFRSSATTFAGAISGTGQVANTTTGGLTLTGNNTYTGSTVNLYSTLQIGNGGTSGSLVGNIENYNLQTVVFNRSDASSYGGVISGGGQLIKRGAGNLSLTGVSTFNGRTTVEAGTLSVNGSIAASSLTTVNAGAALGGNGTVGTTLINGGALAPGNSIGTLNVSGNLTFTAASSYMVEVSPTSADRVNVSGTATLGGATVNASFASGGYVERQYTIVNANGGVIGTFGTLVNTNLPSGFKSSLGYDAKNAYLNLVLDYTPTPPNPPGPPPTPPGPPNPPPPVINSGLNGNQTQVANALSNYFARTGSIPIVFGALTPAGLSIASGETPTGAQQSTFTAMGLFMGVLTDPFGNGRGAPDTTSAPMAFVDAAQSAGVRDAHAMIGKAGALPSFEPRWVTWGAGFGGSQTTDGNATLGSATSTSRLAGIAAGADYWLSPQTVAGFAMAGGATQFGLANGLGSGRSDMMQVGGFIRHSVGASYLTAAAAYGWQDITTERTVGIGGFNQLRASFNANAYSARVEAGHRWVAPVIGGVGLTPYAAAQVTAFDLPAYAEQAVSGNGVFALGYDARTATSTRSELGLRTDKSFAFDGALLTLRGRAAWAHEFDVDRSVAATFQALPGASFLVGGARPARDAALTTVSADVNWLNGFSVGASFEGEFSDVTRSYAGKGVLRYAW
ncbi:autotransporter-associated beta strand repeat-containing protein [Rhodopseudomonas sp.]|uniref:autotransporter-associated beta strand repeat-containing protein n=1 Tax=Rhodopseudomonas sp. TaxID=1078 RepID=UPI003B3AB27F